MTLPASAFSERSYVKDIAITAGLIAAMLLPGFIQVYQAACDGQASNVFPPAFPPASARRS